MDQHGDRIVAGVRVRADHQNADASAAQRVVDDVTARRCGALTYHAALNWAKTAASSPSSEACHAAAAATVRRSRYSRIASATNADLLLPATAALSSSPSSSSRVMEMLTVTSATLPTTLLSARSSIRWACRRSTRDGRPTPVSVCAMGVPRSSCQIWHERRLHNRISGARAVARRPISHWDCPLHGSHFRGVQVVAPGEVPVGERSVRSVAAAVDEGRVRDRGRYAGCGGRRFPCQRTTEPVDARAELVAPHLLFHRDRDRATLGQPVPVAVQLVGVVTAHADHDVVARVVLGPRRDVRTHERVSAGRFEYAVHDPVGVWGVLVTELVVGVQLQVAAEDLLVELHRLAGVAGEVDVRVET